MFPSITYTFSFAKAGHSTPEGFHNCLGVSELSRLIIHRIERGWYLNIVKSTFYFTDDHTEVKDTDIF